MYSTKISFEQAQKIAENAVRSDISPVRLQGLNNLLEEDYLEAECCWIFLRSKKIVIPPEDCILMAYGGYAVSKKGECSLITHFDYSPEKLNAYLKVMSDYYKKSNT
jgi:hypothetical protein